MMELSKIKMSTRFVAEIFFFFTMWLAFYFFSAKYAVVERLSIIFQQSEKWDVDKVLLLFLYAVIAALVLALLRLVKVSGINRLLQARMSGVEKKLSEVRQLDGIIPICTACKNIKDVENSWYPVEIYITEHTHAKFSHGICPECMRQLYPQFIKERGSYTEK